VRNESIGQQLVIDNGTVANNVVVLDERDSLGRTIPYQHVVPSQITEAVS
jgi:hypothetical protein